MLKQSLITALAIAAVGATVPAAAADSNFYAVGSVGRSSIDVDVSSINAFGARNGATTSTSNSSNDVGWKAQLGYQMTPSWGLEGGYTSLGQSKFVVVSAAPAYTASGVKKADLFNLDLVGRAEINKSFSLLGRVGGYYWRTDTDLPFATGLSQVKDTGGDFKIGAGMQYDFTRNFALRGEFERYNGIGKSSSAGDSKVNLFSIGAVLKFQ